MYRGSGSPWQRLAAAWHLRIVAPEGQVTGLASGGPSPYKPGHLARVGGFRRVFLRPRPVSQ